MNKSETRLKWGDLRVLRKTKNYTQVDCGALFGISQSTLSTLETDHADEYVPPELAKKILEAPINLPPPKEKARAKALGQSAAKGAPAPTWPIILGRGPLPPRAKLVEMIPVQVSPSVTRTFVAVQGEDSSTEPGGLPAPPSTGPAGGRLTPLAMMRSCQAQTFCPA